MICEYCMSSHDGNFGSGRFCNTKCARGFSTKYKRKEINEKVSSLMKGKKHSNLIPFKKGFDANRRIFDDNDRKRAISIAKYKRDNLYRELEWMYLPRDEKYRRIRKRQDNVCLWCKNNTWRGLDLVLEIDHINGVHDDNREENLRYLCPNCHSQTPTWKNRKRNGPVAESVDMTDSKSVSDKSSNLLVGTNNAK